MKSNIIQLPPWIVHPSTGVGAGLAQTLSLALCGWAAHAAAATLTVTSAADNGAADTLRAVIAASAPSDTIEFAFPTATTITLVQGEIIISKNLTISGPGPANLTILGASPNARVFEIQPGAAPPTIVSFSRIRFTGGYQAVSGNPGTMASPNGQNGFWAFGGIMYNNADCVLSLSNCLFEQCYAFGGNGGDGFGGIVAQPGAGASGGGAQGGAIWTVGQLAVSGCTFHSNSVAGGNGGAGTNALTSFVGSNGGGGGDAYGGAIYVDYSGIAPLLATNCTFFNNLAIGGTGGAGGNGLSAPAGGNGGSGGNAFGGGVYHGSRLCNGPDCGFMIHCTLSQNYVLPGLGGAGGLGPVNGSPGQNGAGYAGGLGLVPNTFGVGNVIFAADGCIGPNCTGPDVYGTVASLGYNLVSAKDDSGGWNPIAPGLDQTGMAVNPLDAHLGPLQDNGGETATMALLSGSPAIDFGSRMGAPLDQTGQPRPVVLLGIFNGGDGSDIGAYEVPAASGSSPLMTIIPTPTNTVIIAWPAPSSGFILQESPDLGPLQWVASTYVVTITGTQNQVTVPMEYAHRFYRLFHP